MEINSKLNSRESFAIITFRIICALLGKDIGLVLFEDKALCRIFWLMRGKRTKGWRE
jgi:hypothetical protein